MTYPLITLNEAQALSCMISGAPVSDVMAELYQDIANKMVVLVQTGARPVDPATLQRWDAEQQIEWMAQTNHIVHGSKKSYICYHRYQAHLPVDDVRIFSTPGQAIDAQMRREFERWRSSCPRLKEFQFMEDGPAREAAALVSWKASGYC